jgi:hypothetical protein
VLRIVRKEQPTFLAGTITSSRVEPSTIERLVNGVYQIEFIANIPKESFWTGAAIALASKHGAAFGGFGDLRSALTLPDGRIYVKKEFAFVERGLRQHAQVSSLERVDDRKYLVKRHQMSNICVVALNEYELNADQVRTARDRYGAFAAIIITNPNGAPTSAAEQAAKSMGISIYKWGAFLGQLNRR